MKEGRLPQNDKIAVRVVIDSAHYALSGNHEILMRMSKVKLNSSEISLRRVVPKVFKKLICSAYHDTIWSGAHLGRDKTYEKIKRKFFWYKMKEFISKYCNCCLSCLAHKNPKEWSKAKLGNIETSYPWDLVWSFSYHT